MEKNRWQPHLSWDEMTRRILQRDPDALEELCARLRPNIYRMCLRLTRDVLDAEDLTQECLLHVLKRIRCYSGQTHLIAWVRFTSFNRARSLLRPRGATKTPVLLLPLDEIVRSRQDRRRLSAPDPALAGALDRLTLIDALVSIEICNRMTFVLHDIEGYDHDEIAAMFGCSVAASRSRLYRARMKLRTAFKG